MSPLVVKTDILRKNRLLNTIMSDDYRPKGKLWQHKEGSHDFCWEGRGQSMGMVCFPGVFWRGQ